MSDKKTPAFRFYPADFVMGTITMGAAETGAYMLLLCHQWDNGHIPTKPSDCAKIARCSTAIASLLLKSKFPKCDDGKHRNKRLEREREKAEEFSTKQKVNGAKGGKSRWNKEIVDSTAIAPPYPNDGQTHSDAIANTCLPVSGSVSGSCTETNKQSAWPKLTDVKMKADLIGVPADEAEKFWNHFESSGWIDKNGNPILNWESKLRTWSVSARAAPLEREHGASRVQGASTADKILQGKEYERVIARMSQIRGQYADMQTWTPEDKTEMKKLKDRKEVLKRILGITI